MGIFIDECTGAPCHFFPLLKLGSESVNWVLDTELVWHNCGFSEFGGEVVNGCPYTYKLEIFSDFFGPFWVLHLNQLWLGV